MCGSSRSRSASAGGFTLLEVVVAFVILGLAFAAAFEVFSTGIRNVRVTAGYAEAELLAQSKLALLGTAEPIVDGVSEGRFEGGYRWKLEVSPVPAEMFAGTPAEQGGTPPEESNAPAAPDEPVEPVRDLRVVAVALTVSWGEAPARSLTLDTYRLVEASDQ